MWSHERLSHAPMQVVVMYGMAQLIEGPLTCMCASETQHSTSLRSIRTAGYMVKPF